MYNSKRYEISDVAHPALVFKNDSYVNPAYPSQSIVMVDKADIEIKDFEFLDAMKHRLKRARKRKDGKQIRAIKALLKEIS